MCGIAGAIGLSVDIAAPAVRRMQAALRHRGPDDEGLVEVAGPAAAPPVILAHRRLAIIDLSATGHQPMIDPQTGSALVFNGEIFNYQSIGAALRDLGDDAPLHNDTESILRAHRAWGVDAVHRLRGMFAFCLVDPRRERVWLCRDRMGIKPLYTYRPQRGGLLFASEVRSLLAAGPALVPRRVSRTQLESYLAQGMVCGLSGIVEGVELVPPGTHIETNWTGGELRRERYWSIPFRRTDDPTPGPNRGDAVGALSRTLRDAVTLRLISDVPLGLFLSSGIDSSVLATLATDVGRGSVGSVATLAVGFDQARYDESLDAARIAETLGTDHRRIVVTGDEMLASMGEVFAAMDQPSVDGFNTYFVSRAARSAGLTVALSGVGGDELFGGYRSFRDVPRAARVARALRFLGPGRGVARRGAALLPGRSGAKVEALFERSTLGPLGCYLLRRELFLSRERRELQRLPKGVDVESGLPYTLLGRLSDESLGLDDENTVSSFELRSYMRDMLLRDADVFSMAVGLELRVPLVDHELVEAVAPLPGRWKRPDPRPKPLLVDAAGPRLPSEVIRRPKRGFSFPWDPWLRGPLRDRARQALGDEDVWAAVDFFPGTVRSMWDRFAAGDPRVGASQIVALWVLREYVVQHGLSVGA